MSEELDEKILEEQKQKAIQLRIDKCKLAVEEALKTHRCKLVYVEYYRNGVLSGANITVEDSI